MERRKKNKIKINVLHIFPLSCYTSVTRTHLAQLLSKDFKNSIFLSFKTIKEKHFGQEEVSARGNPILYVAFGRRNTKTAMVNWLIPLFIKSWGWENRSITVDTFSTHTHTQKGHYLLNYLPSSNYLLNIYLIFFSDFLSHFSSSTTAQQTMYART